MNIKNTIMITGLIALTSCASSEFYQVYEIKSEESQKGLNMIYHQNEKLKVYYDFWGPSGDAGFTVENLTGDFVYLDMEHSYLTINGLAQTYYQKREFVNRTTKSRVAPGTFRQIKYGEQNISGVNYREKRFLTIPPYSKKVVSGFQINTSLIEDCAVKLYPRRNETDKQTFNVRTTPIFFTNVLHFTTDINNTEKLESMEADFYISVIVNMNKNRFLESYYPEKCGQTARVPSKKETYKSPRRFYVKYSKGR